MSILGAAIFVCAFIGISASRAPLASTPLGKVQGQLSTSYNGKTFMEFIGIPYAIPPIGFLRFEDPKPSQPWTGTWIANTTTPCLQFTYAGKPEGQEDCLNLNVFVPGEKVDIKSKFDVLVHFHDGGFVRGSSTSYAGPKYLMDRDVILVTINYRLGIFGFLSTEDEHLPGNMGMKDQVMALRWINENIDFFGGNPDSITISGLTSGAASVHYHLLSPLSRNLFKRAISVSGTALNPWALQHNAAKKATTLAKTLGCTQKDVGNMVDCLKIRNSAQINKAMKVYGTWLYDSDLIQGPVIDKDSKEPFMPEHPYKILSEGEIHNGEWLVAAASSEGLYPALDFITNEGYLEHINKNWEEIVPALLHYLETISEEQHSEISQKVKKFYFDEKPVDKNSYQKLVKMIGDRLFMNDFETAIRMHAKKSNSPVYFYMNDYVAKERESFVNMYNNTKERFGVAHGDDHMFIFSNVHSERKFNEADEKMKDFLLDLWISFAKNGKTDITGWKSISKNCGDKIQYLHVSEVPEVKEVHHFGERAFWETIHFQENKNLFKTTKEEL